MRASERRGERAATVCMGQGVHVLPGARGQRGWACGRDWGTRPRRRGRVGPCFGRSRLWCGAQVSENVRGG